MTVIDFPVQEHDLFSMDIAEVPFDELPALRSRVEMAIADLDSREPRSQHSEAYEDWAEEHEFLEDILDEILDRMEP